MSEDLTNKQTAPTSDDFIPIDESASLPELTHEANQNLSMADKIRYARLAMEGPERTIKREREEKEKKIEAEKAKLNQALALVLKKKEDLEIGWVVLDNKRLDLKKILAPILTEEEALELKEEGLEGKERTTITPTDRQVIEKERWEIQDKRHTLEKQKWDYENKIIKIEELVKENTDKYQILLDEEEEITQKLEDLDSDLILMSEQIKLEQEEKIHKIELAEVEAERKKREEIEKKEIATSSQRKKEEAEKKEKAEAEAKLAKEKKEAEAKKLDEEKKAELSAKIKNQNTPGVRVAMTDSHTDVLSVADKAIDEAKKREAKLAELRARGAQEINRLNTGDKKPQTSQPLVSPITENKPKEKQIEKTVPTGLDLPSMKPVNLNMEEEYDLPKVRTLKTDTARMQAGDLNKGDKNLPWFNK